MWSLSVAFQKLYFLRLAKSKQVSSMSLLLFNRAIPLHFPKYMVVWQCSQAHQRSGKWKSDNLKSEKNTNTIDLICMDFSTKITSWIE